MPDEKNPPTQPNGAPPPASPPAASDQRPSWLPEGFNKPEELASRYQEYDRRLKEIEPALQTAKRWERWGDPDQFEKNLAAQLTAQQKKWRAEWEAEYRAQQAPAQQKDPFEGWEMMDPRQQAAIQAQYVQQAVLGEVQKAIENYWAQGRNQLNEYDQRFQLLARAITDKTGNADLDLNQLWKEASNLATGDPSKLYDLAYERATAAKRLEAEVARAVAAEQAKLKQEYDNKLNAALTGPGSGTSAMSFKDMIAARKDSSKEGIRNRVLQKLLQSGDLVPGQL